MQKVVGSSPIIRSQKAPLDGPLAASTGTHSWLDGVRVGVVRI
jgi:hypothetical protein